MRNLATEINEEAVKQIGLRKIIEDIIKSHGEIVFKAPSGELYEISDPDCESFISDLASDIIAELREYKSTLNKAVEDATRRVHAQRDEQMTKELSFREETHRQEVEHLRARIKSLEGKEAKAVSVLEYKLSEAQSQNRRLRNALRCLVGSETK